MAADEPTTRLRRLSLRSFRNYHEVDLSFADGLTAVIGDNGQGKTNLLEAIGFLATLQSFRGVGADALIMAGAESAVIRADIETGDRAQLVEAEIGPGTRTRVLVNKQKLKRAKDLLGVIRVTIFSPDDLVLVKGPPGGRRRFLDDTLVSLHAKYDTLRSEVDRILRQRNAVLKQQGGRPALADDVALTLDVWDAKLATAGEELVRARLYLLELLEPLVVEAYLSLATSSGKPRLGYLSEWVARAEGELKLGLAEALSDGRPDDLRRGVTLHGPHRDDVHLSVNDLPARTHASQGEQRSLALALRLASHRLVAERTGATPVLLLDDVFSELDPGRSNALVEHVPGGQAVLTTAGALPAGIAAEQIVRVRGGSLEPQATP